MMTRAGTGAPGRRRRMGWGIRVGAVLLALTLVPAPAMAASGVEYSGIVGKFTCKRGAPGKGKAQKQLNQAGPDKSNKVASLPRKAKK